jgi:hypothetical protein
LVGGDGRRKGIEMSQMTEEGHCEHCDKFSFDLQKVRNKNSNGNWISLCEECLEKSKEKDSKTRRLDNVTVSFYLYGEGEYYEDEFEQWLGGDESKVKEWILECFDEAREAWAQELIKKEEAEKRLNEEEDAQDYKRYLYLKEKFEGKKGN